MGIGVVWVALALTTHPAMALQWEAPNGPSDRTRLLYSLLGG